MQAARCLLASRGVSDASPEALVGALLEVEHRLLIQRFLGV